MLDENEKLKAFYDENKKTLIKEAKLEAQQIIKNANKLVENTIAQIKEHKADKEKTQELRNQLHTELKKNEIKVDKPKQAIVETTEIKEGDWIKLTDSGNIAQVLEVNKDNLIIAFGELRSVVKKNRAIKVSNSEVPKDLRKLSKITHTQSAADFVSEIDAIGKRGDDTVHEIEKYLYKTKYL